LTRYSVSCLSSFQLMTFKVCVLCAGQLGTPFALICIFVNTQSFLFPLTQGTMSSQSRLSLFL